MCHSQLCDETVSNAAAKSRTSCRTEDQWQAFPLHVSCFASDWPAKHAAAPDCPQHLGDPVDYLCSGTGWVRSLARIHEGGVSSPPVTTIMLHWKNAAADVSLALWVPLNPQTCVDPNLFCRLALSELTPSPNNQLPHPHNEILSNHLMVVYSVAP